MYFLFVLAEDLEVYSNSQDDELMFWREKCENLLAQNKKLEEDLTNVSKQNNANVVALADLQKAHEELTVEHNRLKKEDTQDILELKEKCDAWTIEFEKREKEFEKEREKLKQELANVQEQSHNQISKAKTAKSRAESKHADLVCGQHPW